MVGQAAKLVDQTRLALLFALCFVKASKSELQLSTPAIT
jgi:hypothetical protein